MDKIEKLDGCEYLCKNLAVFKGITREYFTQTPTTPRDRSELMKMVGGLRAPVYH